MVRLLIEFQSDLKHMNLAYLEMTINLKIFHAEYNMYPKYECFNFNKIANINIWPFHKGQKVKHYYSHCIPPKYFRLLSSANKK